MQPSDVGTIDNLYVDLNSLMYPAVNLAAERLLAAATASGASAEGRWAMRLQEAEDAILSAFVTILEQMCVMAPPVSLLYMAADGVSPIGKMAQQRARRQNSSARHAAQLLCDASGFDITSLTCGTAFMERVTHAAHFFAVSYTDRINHQRLQRYVASLRSSEDPSAVAKPLLLTSVVNDATSPGEGEHKIFEAIRAFRRGPQYRHDVRHCVCSSDTDVIVSALTLHEPYMFALRFDPSGPHEPTTFTITKFREALYLRFGSPIQRSDFEKALHDFVFLLLLFGNDFLPRISATADIAEGTLDRMLQFLADHFVHRGKRLVSETTGEVFMDAAVYFLEYLEEISGSGGCTVGLSGGRLKGERQSGGAGLQVHGDVDWGFDAPPPTATPPIITTPDPDDGVESRCHAYWTMLQWAMQYSSSGDVPSWNVAYPYRSVPTIQELCRHCRVQWDTVVVKGVANKPLDVTTQLLLLTPTRSARNVIPASLLWDYDTTICSMLNQPFEDISIKDVAAWSEARRSRLTESERKRLQSYDSGGLGIAACWDRDAFEAECQIALQTAKERHAAEKHSSTVAEGMLPVTEVRPAATAAKMATIFGAKRGLASLPGLSTMALPSTASQAPKLPDMTPSPPPPQTDVALLSSTADIAGYLAEGTFYIQYTPLPSYESVAISTIDGATFRGASPFHAESATLALKRGVATNQHFLRLRQAQVHPHASAPCSTSAVNPPTWLPLPRCADADIVAVMLQRLRDSRKRDRDGDLNAAVEPRRQGQTREVDEAADVQQRIQAALKIRQSR